MAYTSCFNKTFILASNRGCILRKVEINEESYEREASPAFYKTKNKNSLCISMMAKEPATGVKGVE